MLTIFAIPKPFLGHNGVIQLNAIQSWRQLSPQCEIILFGDEEGTQETAERYGTRFIPHIERNEYGTPLVSALFDMAQKSAGHELICYVNADIILMSGFLPAINRIQSESFLCVGRRWDIDLKEPLDFNQPSWEEQLRRRLAQEGKLHAVSGLDYFVFPRGMYRDIPPLAIGRTAWDNWLLYKARSLGMTVIDATGMITAVHQNHDYAHYNVTGDEARGLWKGVEAQRNLELIGGTYYSFILWDVTHLLTPDGIKPARSMRHLLWRLFRFPELHPKFTPVAVMIKGLRSVAYRIAALRQLYGKLKS